MPKYRETARESLKAILGDRTLCIIREGEVLRYGFGSLAPMCGEWGGGDETYDLCAFDTDGIVALYEKRTNAAIP